MDEDDEVGEVDFPFDLSDWMVVDEHAEDEEEDRNDESGQSEKMKKTAAHHNEGKSAPEVGMKATEAKESVKSKSSSLTSTSTKSPATSSTTKTDTKKTHSASDKGGISDKDGAKSATPTKSSTPVKKSVSRSKVSRDSSAKIGSSAAPTQTVARKPQLPQSQARTSSAVNSSSSSSTLQPQKKTATTLSAAKTVTEHSPKAAPVPKGITRPIKSASSTISESASAINTATTMATTLKAPSAPATTIKTSSTTVTAVSIPSTTTTAISVPSTTTTAIKTSSTTATAIGVSSTIATAIKTPRTTATAINVPSTTAATIKTSSSTTTAIKPSTVATVIQTPSITTTTIKTSSTTTVIKTTIATPTAIKSTSTTTSSTSVPATSNATSLPQTKTTAKQNVAAVSTSTSKSIKTTPVIQTEVVSSFQTAQSVKPSMVPQPTKPQAQTKAPASVKFTSEDSGSIADIMEAGEDRDDDDGGSPYDYDNDVEDISDTELSEMLESVSGAPPSAGKSKSFGMKRESSPSRDGPVAKKAKVTQASKVHNVTSTITTTTAGSSTTIQTGSKKPDESGVKKAVKKPAVIATGTAKKSFGAVKAPAVKPKAQAPVTSTLTKSAEVRPKGETPAIMSTPTVTSKAPAKRIVRRFHRMTQTLPKQQKSKLLQCLIRIPALDTPMKSKSSTAVQTRQRDEVFYQKELPDTLRQEVFKVVSAFNVNSLNSRSISSECFDYGISMGQIASADLEKSLFRENILTKADYYDLSFDRQDFGVVDLFFGDEEKFSTVMTHIRKTRIGPRHLAVTFSKNLKLENRDPKCSLSSVKATIIFDQNCASTGFLTHMKAPVWNKPKVEEYVTIHNVPSGIPLDFLRLLIPDAITIDLDDETLQFTQEGSRVRMGLNRKIGSDRVLKLFTKIYLNNECLIITNGLTDIKDVPEVKEILMEKKRRPKESNLPLREMKAVARDINDEAIIIETDDEAEVIMQVENVEQVEKVLTGRAAAWKGPSTAEQLRKAAKEETKAASQLKSSVNKSGSSFSKDPALSDVSDELSDISDTSNLGEDASPHIKGQTKTQAPYRRKSSTAQRAATVRSSRDGRESSSRLYRGKGHDAEHRDVRERRMHQEDRDKRRKSRSVSSSESRRRHERGDRSLTASRHSDRFQDDGRYRSPSQRSIERSAPASQVEWQEREQRATRDQLDRSMDVKERFDKFREERLRYDYEQERPGHDAREGCMEVRLQDEPLSSREKLHRERLELDRQEKEKRDRYKSPRLKQPDRDRFDDRGDLGRGRERERNRSEEADSNRLNRDRHGNIIERPPLYQDEVPANNQGNILERTNRSWGESAHHEDRYRDSRTGPREMTREGGPLDDVLKRYTLDRRDGGAKYEKRDSLTKYDERDGRRGERLDRPVRERMSSLERHRGGMERSRVDERIVVRARSPLTRRIVRGRSASPRRGGSAPRAPGPARRFSPSPSRTFRRVTLVRRSATPPRGAVRGSALSPISVGDENDEGGGNLNEGMWLSQPPSGYGYPPSQGREGSSHIQTVAGRTNREDVRKSGPHTGTSKNLVAVQTDQKRQRLRRLSGDGSDRKPADSGSSKNFLEKFVEEIIATSRSQSGSQAPGGKERSLFGPGLQDPVKFLEKMREIYGSGVKFTDTGSGTGAASHSSGVGQSGMQGSNTRTVGSYSDNTEASGLRGLSTRPVQDSGRSGGQASQTQASNYESRSNYEMNRDLPPPIPPPVAPPLFTPVASSQERMAQMEALAKQLAADIEKQQQTQQQPMTQAVWNVPPPVSMALTQLSGPPPPRMLGPSPHLRGPPPMTLAGSLPFPNISGPQALRPPNIGPPPAMGPHPALWPPRSSFF